ncbi:MAG: branched-chain amino acid ABC transporter permease [Clostridiales bacterium]|nr:branched-chain amino acid ABC transporter permease [Clostridiales bacterium]
MLQKNEKRAGTLRTMLAIMVLLLFVIVLENISSWIPGMPAVFSPTSQLFTVLKKGAVYSLVAVSMNLLNGFTGLFSLGQAGFMLLGAYTYAILTVPMAAKDQVYYLYGGSAVKFSLVDAFQSLFGVAGFGGAVSLICAVLVGIICAGLVAALFAALIGTPVLRLKSDYLAIATLGFAEILRAIFQWQTLGPITNGANMLKSFPTFADFNIKNAAGQVVLRLSTFVPFLLSILCITVIVLLIHSSYGRAFKAIRDDEVAAEAMGISLFKHKMLSFVISSFFSGVGGALFAMYVSNAQAKAFTSTMTYEILLIVVIGGIGSISGSVIGTFLYVACSEWWLRFLDAETYIGSFKVPLLRSGFRMVVFSVVIMIIVLFFSQGIMGEKELTWAGIGGLLKKLKPKKKAASAGKEG